MFEQGMDEFIDLLVVGEVVCDNVGLVEHFVVFEGIDYVDQC